MQDGVIYVAKGADYVDLAIRSAKSLKRFNPGLMIDLFTDQECGSPIFDGVFSLGCGPTPKLACLTKTRFQRTLYLDCDTIILADFEDLFDVLKHFSIALTHDVRRTSNLIRESGIHETPYAFPQMNAGVILYRSTSDVMNFFDEWKTHYIRLGRQRDQVSLKDLLWESDLRFYVLPPEFNLRRVTMLDAWEPLDVRPTIMHSHRLLQHLRDRAPCLRDIAEVLPSERLALKKEWEAILGSDPITDADDPIAKFRIAENSERRARDGTT